MSRDAEFARRWPLAQAYGWRIKYEMYKNELGNHVPRHKNPVVKAPADYCCEKYTWAADYEMAHWNGETITVPGYFWDDDVLRYGTRLPADHDTSNVLL